MNAITTTGGNSLVPQDMNAAMQMANMMATSKLRSRSCLQKGQRATA